MKHSIILLTALCGFSSAFAFAPAETLNLSVNKLASVKTDGFLKPVEGFRPEVKKAIAPATTQIITEITSGTLMKEVVWSSKAAYPENNKVKWTEVSGFVPNIVINGNEMFIYAPITALSEIAAAWIKGTISADGTTVTFPTPQAYMINEATPGVITTLYATRLDGTTGKVDETNLDITFSYVDGELIQNDGGVIGLTDLNGNFYGYADMDITVKKIADKPLSLPESAELWSYMLEYKKGGQTQHLSTMIALDGEDVYLADPVVNSEYWFKGTMKDGKLVVPTPQYIGAASGYPLYLVTGSEFTYMETEPMTGQQYQVTDYMVQPGADIVFSFDENTLVYSTDQLMLFSSDKDKKGSAYSAFMAPVYNPWTPTPATPAKPEVTYYIDLKDYEAYGLRGCLMSFEIPDKSTDGDPLPQENLYYQIGFDDKLLEFYGVTMIPFFGNFQDASIETSLTVNGTTHQLQVPNKPEFTISLQSFYEINGEYLASDKYIGFIVDGELQGSFVKETVSEDITTVRYFDLSGRQASAGTKGILIRQEVMSDGTLRNSKIYNR